MACANREADSALSSPRSHDVSPIDEPQQSEDAIGPRATALIRRRSFAPPGLATRHDRNRRIERPAINPLRSHPVTSEDLNLRTIWREERTVEHTVEAPPLNRLATIAYSNGGQDSSYSRVQTPGDVSHLGSLQLGSLVVTNGAASPAPSIAGTARALTPTQSIQDFDDYFTASEEHPAPADRILPHTFALRDAMLRSAKSFENRRPPVPKVVHNSDSKNSFQLPAIKLEKRGPSPLKQAAKSDATGDVFQDLKQAQPQLQVQVPQIARSASHYARGYLSEMPSSPYSGRPDLHVAPNVNRSVSQESTSQYSVATDEGFVEGQLDDTIPDGASFTRTGVDFFDDDDEPVSPASEADNVMKTPVKTLRPTQWKADSGYSSSASTKGLPTPPEERDISPLFDRAAEQKLIPRDMKSSYGPQGDAKSLYTFDQMLQELPPIAASYFEPSYVDISETIRPAPKPARMPLLRSVSWGRKSQASITPMTSTASIPTIATTQTSKSQPESRKGKKLQKSKLKKKKSGVQVRRPASRDGDKIPRIPTPLSRKHSTRLIANAGTGHLEQTYGSPANEELRVVELDLGEPLEIRFPSRSFEEDFEEALKQNKKKRRSQRFSVSKTAKTEPNSRSRSPPKHRTGVKSIFRRGSRSPSIDRPRPSVEDETMIAEFGAAAEFLGASPYDAATVMSRPSIHRSSTQTAPGVLHPHQLSNRGGRPRSWTEMDDQTAKEFARMKSRQRAAIVEAHEAAEAAYVKAQHVAAQRAERPGMRRRPNSFSGSVRSLRSASHGSVSSLRRSKTYHEDEGYQVPSRTSSTGSEYGRGRPKSFEEWELQRRHSGGRSRSRPRALLANANAPPVPPLPAQTLEIDEEHFFSPTAPKIKNEDKGASKTLVKPDQGHVRRNSDNAPEVVVEPDWSSSSDVWRQRRMLLSKNLHVQVHGAGGSVQPLKSKNAIHEADQDELVSPVEPLDDMLPPAIVVSRYLTPTPTRGLMELDANESERQVERHELSASPPTRRKHARTLSAKSRFSSSAPSSEPRESVSSSAASIIRMTPFEQVTGRSPSPAITKTSTKPSPSRARIAMVDRFSGGLSYEYEPGKGVGGSAGMRVLKSSTARRSGPMSQGYGVDLSDVPVYLAQRVN